MNFSEFYLMGGGLTRGAFHVRAKTQPLDELGLLRGSTVPDEPVVFEQSGGGKARDVIGCEYPGIKLLSSRVVDLLEEERFTGWTTFPVEVYDRKGERVDGYLGFVVTGRCGPVDWSKGVLTRMPPPVPEGRSYDAWVGLYFDIFTWDGSDIFMPDIGYVFVVERVKRAMARARVKNIHFQPLTEFERTWSVNANRTGSNES